MLLGGVISELVLILVNLDFEINRNSLNLGRFVNDIHIPTRAKYFPHFCLGFANLFRQKIFF
jgi:hypothetical protein